MGWNQASGGRQDIRWEIRGLTSPGAPTQLGDVESGMRQLAGTKTRYRMAHAAPLAGLISDRAEYNGESDDVDRSICLVTCDPMVHRVQTGITRTTRRADAQPLAGAIVHRVQPRITDVEDARLFRGCAVFQSLSNLSQVAGQFLTIAGFDRDVQVVAFRDIDK